MQIGTENQTHHRIKSSSTSNRQALLETAFGKVDAALGQFPGTIIADTEYGREKNYAYLNEEACNAVVKYSTYHKENSKSWQTDISKLDNWTYDEKNDAWICVEGQKLTFRYERKTMTESGFEIQTRHYRSSTCDSCPLKPKCTKAKGDREIQVSMNYIGMKRQAREQLKSEDGYAL
ncbi:hypothetical protein FHS18_003830 [Paenibacillus phyllosphaerae]|uniref:Transposase DDE domain-containing protein n=1 Tax=Paenibacillus phyllosphaerae TaxID=274593 RepID=A0A7W5FP23_9BACL|nr:hypothetical protein [Paenibacillus phyllosphaerae]